MRCERGVRLASSVRGVLRALAGASVALAAVAALAAGPADFERTPARLERGRYLMTGVVDCAGCHSQRDFTKFNAPPKQGLRFAGGLLFLEIGKQSFTPNITPYALSGWTDAQIATALTRGIRPDGRVLDPHMPYRFFEKMDPEDLAAIVVYLRSLDPVAGGPYPFEIKPPAGPLRAPPEKRYSRPPEDAPDELRGEYLAFIGGCNGCHIGPPDSKVAGIDFAGGREFRAPVRGVSYAANLTPDTPTGIGSWTREAFVARIKAMGSPAVQDAPWQPGERTSRMPYWLYGNMTERDLGAIWAYLRTLPPVENALPAWQPLPGTMMPLNWSEMPHDGDAAAAPH